jgi:SAM-dependent methyltransferase
MLNFDSAYAGTPGWDIGRPQPAMAALAQSDGWRGRVLDVGCGTGEHALLAVSIGLEATGVDSAATAIARAVRKAKVRGLSARFVVGDALDLGDLGDLGRYDTVLDSGLFHVLEDNQRRRYAESLHSVTRFGGSCYLLCFSERQGGRWPPRRVSREELRASFTLGWDVAWIQSETFELIGTAGAPEVALAWMARIDRH